jgi:hypothetical protein
MSLSLSVSPVPVHVHAHFHVGIILEITTYEKKFQQRTGNWHTAANFFAGIHSIKLPIFSVNTAEAA